MVLSSFIVVDFDLWLKMRDFKLELKVLVGCLLYDLITWLLYTVNGNAEIILRT